MLKLLMLCLFLVSCSSDEGKKNEANNLKSITDNRSFFEAPGLVKAISQTHYSKELVECAYKTREESCQYKDLDFLKSSGEDVVIKEILERTVISNQWMKNRFKNLLLKFESKDLYNLFRGVRGVVISNRLSTSFYTYHTGYIYLQGSYFAKTQTEKDSLIELEDYRATRYSDFDFIESNYHVLNEKRISIYKNESEFKDIKALALLYHELAHANDFFPVSEQKDLLASSTNSTLDDGKQRSNFNSLISQNLDEPRSKNEFLEQLREYTQYGIDLKDFAVFDYTSEKVAEEIASTNAMKTYAYASYQEHMATLLENYLLLKNHNIETHNVFLVSDESSEDEAKYTIKNGFVNKVLREDISKNVESLYELVFNEKSDFKNLEFKFQKIKPDTPWDQMFDDNSFQIDKSLLY